MQKISILSPFVADLIAAGEVVERPASVVKELFENSVDAGARNITVEIRSGGTEYIRVTDDGCGMSPEDAGIAFLRHATSKLRDEKGLEAINTLGFRGEALAAIGSVSHIELLSRECGSRSGTRLLLDGGDIVEMGEFGCPEGTTLIVRGLFYNTPARLKFMKTDRSEGASCVAAALRCALGHPEIAVRCIRDGKEEFFTPGDGQVESCAYSLLGRELASSLLPVSIDDSGIKVSGFVSSPSAGRGSRAQQYFFCNGRHIKSQLLQAAVEQAYRNTLLTGRFPACVMYITLGFGTVDVNVHPAKTEIKFSDEKRVFDAVYYAALGALEGAPEGEASRIAALPSVSAPKIITTPPEPRVTAAIREPALYYQTRMDMSKPKCANLAPEIHGQSGQAADPPAMPSPRSAAPPPFIPAPAAVDTPVRVIGEALGLYIIAEKDGALILIDKHAAHERIIFDALQKTGGEALSQTLLEPVTLNAGAEDAELLSRSGELFSDLGFEVEPYGEGIFILRAAPCGIGPFDARAAVEEILDSLKKGLRPDPRTARDEALKTIACKAAIKAGRQSEPDEIQKLAAVVCSGEIRYCPHGRPVAWTLSRTDLDKAFKRIV